MKGLVKSVEEIMVGFVTLSLPARRARIDGAITRDDFQAISETAIRARWPERR